MPIVRGTGIAVGHHHGDDPEGDRLHAAMRQAVLDVHAEHALDGRHGPEADPDPAVLKARMDAALRQARGR